MNDLLVFDHPAATEHRAPTPHPERPERVLAARRALARLPRERVKTRHAPEVVHEVALRVHDRDHVERMLALPAAWTAIDADTYVGPGTRQAVATAAGGAHALGTALGTGLRRGFALTRPPGHHAEPAKAMGFCLLNNIAIAAASARAAGARRVAIVDWDAHHGNGTQAIFEGDGTVLFVSLHQWPLFPGTGRPAEIGRGEGIGRTVNVALPPGSGPAEYAAAFRTLVLPILEAHRPDVILVSAGFDAHRRDPLAELRLDEASFAWMAAELSALADRRDAGLGFVLEGGYDLEALEQSLAATLTAALDGGPGTSNDEPSPRARAAMELTKSFIAPHWPELGWSV